METKSVITALSALAQDSRLAIFRYLVEVGPQGAFVGQIAEGLGLAAATLSFHLKELSHASLVRSEQNGRFIRYAANFETMNSLIEYLTENCCGGDAGACGIECKPTPKKSSRKKTVR